MSAQHRRREAAARAPPTPTGSPSRPPRWWRRGPARRAPAGLPAGPARGRRHPRRARRRGRGPLRGVDRQRRRARRAVAAARDAAPTACSPRWTATRSSCAPPARRSPTPASPPSRARLIFGTPAEVLPRLSPGAYDMVVCDGPPAGVLRAPAGAARPGPRRRHADLPRPAGRRPDRRPHRPRPADRRLAGDRPHDPRGRDAAVGRPADRHRPAGRHQALSASRSASRAAEVARLAAPHGGRYQLRREDGEPSRPAAVAQGHPRWSRHRATARRTWSPSRTGPAPSA